MKIPKFETHLFDWGGGHSHGVRVTEAKGYVVVDIVCDGSCHGAPKAGVVDWMNGVVAKYMDDSRPCFMHERGQVTAINQKALQIKKRMTLRFAFPTRHGPPGLHEITMGPKPV